MRDLIGLISVWFFLFVPPSLMKRAGSSQEESEAKRQKIEEKCFECSASEGLSKCTECKHSLCANCTSKYPCETFGCQGKACPACPIPPCSREDCNKKWLCRKCHPVCGCGDKEDTKPVDCTNKFCPECKQEEINVCGGVDCKVWLCDECAVGFCEKCQTKYCATCDYLKSCIACAQCGELHCPGCDCGQSDSLDTEEELSDFVSDHTDDEETVV